MHHERARTASFELGDEAPVSRRTSWAASLLHQMKQYLLSPGRAESGGKRDADAAPADRYADAVPETGAPMLRVPSEEHMRIDLTGTHAVEDELWAGEDMPSRWFSWRKLWRFTGPGFLMSIGYIDPGNLEGDLQAGANTGYTLLWLLVWSTAMGFILQRLAAKLGVATGKHLAQHCRAEYPTVPRLLMWLMIEIAIIGCDIQEVIGSAIAIFLLSKGAVPLYAGVLITAIDSFLLLLIERCGVRNLEALFAMLVGVMALSFGVMFVDAHVPAGEVAKGLILPRLPPSAVHYAVAIVGAIIMPHNIYLHSALVQSRKINAAAPARKKEAVAYFSIESALALVISLFINICVVAVFARGFYGKGSADIGLQNAGQFLGKTFGQSMELIWAVGLLAAGQSSTMTGTYSGQFVMSGFLDLGVSQWQRVAITRSVAIAPTLLVALMFRGENSKLDELNEWINVLQSVQLPFALVPLLAMTSSERIMGRGFVNSGTTKVVGWSVAVGIMAVNASDIWEFASGLSVGRAVLAGLGTGVVLYLLFIAYLVVGPERFSRWHAAWRERHAGVGIKLPQDEGPLLAAAASDSRRSSQSSLLPPSANGAASNLHDS